jgi:hypothetical protein
MEQDGVVREGMVRGDMDRSSAAHSHAAWLAPAAVFALVLLAQLPLILNPGYFSHDELQWAAFATEGHPVAWTAIREFQYRPLTFSLWMWLSRAWFAQPQAFHAVLVAWGAANAALVCGLSRRFGMATGPAIIGALVFALGPYATFVHGWVGTLADLAWLSCALLCATIAVRQPRAWLAAVAAAALTTVGLLAKEAAVSIPALLALAWWFDGRKRAWAGATLGAGGVTALYLALRIGVLLHAPRTGDQYTLDIAHLPLRWFEYQVYPAIPSLFETFNTLSRGFTSGVAAATAAWCALLVVLWRSHPRLVAVFLLAGFAALGPVLLLGASFNHYAYGFAAITAATAAAAWMRAAPWARGVLALLALVSTWHGVNVMRQIRHVGEVQSVFSPALADVLRGDAGHVRLRIAPDADDWIFQRLTHEVPSYDGVDIGDRVELVAADATASAVPVDFIIAADGHLLPPR